MLLFEALLSLMMRQLLLDNLHVELVVLLVVKYLLTVLIKQLTDHLLLQQITLHSQLEKTQL